MSTPVPVVPPGAMATSRAAHSPDALDQPQSVRLTAEGAIDITALPSILLIGEQGSGKTHAIRSLLDSGFERIVVVALEPGIQDVLGDLPKDKVSWKFINPYSMRMKDLAKAYKLMGTMSRKSIQEMGHISREKFQEFITLMATCEEFVDDRTGESLGKVEDFPTNWAFVIEGLSGLGTIVQHFTIGVKPFMDLGDYQAIQNPIMEFLNTLTNESKCLFVMTAHLEREIDENTNQSVLTMSTIGRKMAPKLGRYFSDVILTERTRDGGKSSWHWETDSPQIKLKTRNLPYSDNLVPNFKLLIANWKAKQAKGAA